MPFVNADANRNLVPHKTKKINLKPHYNKEYINNIIL